MQIDWVKELAEIPPKIREEMTFTPVASMDQVLRIALMPSMPEDRTETDAKVAKRTPPAPVLMPTEVAAESEMPPPAAPDPAQDTTPI